MATNTTAKTTRTKTVKTPLLKTDAKGRVVNPDKSISVGKPTRKGATTTVFGIEFEQGTDGATFGQFVWSPEGGRYWGYRNTGTPGHFIKVGDGFVVWFQAYATDQFLTTMFLRPTEHQYITIMDFEG
jgi:hypothetical protein